MRIYYDLWRQSVAGLRLLIVLTLACGVIYPVVVFGFGRAVAPWRAAGSMVTADGEHTQEASRAVGSTLIGQPLDDPSLFQNRPSAAGDGYDMLSSYGSNLGPQEPTLIDSINDRRADVAEREGVEESAVPPDAVTASASGLDPDISRAYADLQVPRVAAANGLTEDLVGRLVDDHTSGRTWGILGESHVNVLMLNLAVRAASSEAG